jgi:prepilin-type N-terminal cleavage/methylation domain-containing protein
MFINRTASIERRRGSPAGFTLLEVIAAAGLISIVMAGVFGIATASMELGRSMSAARLVETRVGNFVACWRDYLENLPGGSSLHAAVTAGPLNSSVPLFLECSPPPFAWTAVTRQADAVEILTRRTADRKEPVMDLVVRHLVRPERPTVASPFETVAELVLLEGLTEFQARFYDPSEDRWFVNWDGENRPGPPLFVRIKFRLQEDSRLHEHTFWLQNNPFTPGALPAGA